MGNRRTTREKYYYPVSSVKSKNKSTDFFTFSNIISAWLAVLESSCYYLGMCEYVCIYRYIYFLVEVWDTDGQPVKVAKGKVWYK